VLKKGEVGDVMGETQLQNLREHQQKGVGYRDSEGRCGKKDQGPPRQKAGRGASSVSRCIGVVWTIGDGQEKNSCLKEMQLGGRRKAKEIEQVEKTV